MTTWAAITYPSKSQLIPPPPHIGTHSTTHIKYKFDKTDREVFESTLEEALGSADFSGHLSTSDLDKYNDFIVTAISTAVDKAIPKSKSVRPESNPISNATLALIKEKRRLRRQYSQKKDPAIKTRINQLQKQVKEELKVESLVSWEKFCNSISLETNSTESWRKIKNFLKRKGQRDYPTLHHANKVAKTNADKAQLFAESVDIFMLLRTQMTIDLTLEMNMSLWQMSMPQPPLS